MEYNEEMKERRRIKLELDGIHKSEHRAARAARDKAKKLRRELKKDRKDERRKAA